MDRFTRYHLTGEKTVDSRTIRVTSREAMVDLLSDSRFILCGVSLVLSSTM